MEMLKKLRLASGKTQAEVAQQLRTTQQTYARWEGGKVSPPLSALRDLAVLFGTSVDYLLGRGPAKPATTRYHLLTEDSDGFWGHLGLLWPDGPKTIWYPITAGEVERVHRKLSDVEAPAWIVVETLNNRVLVFRPAQMKRIWLLDDACDGPAGDWDLTGPWDDSNGVPLELYKAMADWVDSELAGLDDFERNNSPALRETALAMIEEGEFLDRPDDLSAFLRQTVIHFTDGSTVKYEVDQKHLEILLADLEFEMEPSLVELSEAEGDFESFYPIGALRMIDLPMIALELGSREKSDW